MRKISASYIISNAGTPLKNGILVLNDDNSVVELIDREGTTKEIQNLEYYSGVLVPGFVDCFAFLSWPKTNCDQIILSNLSELNLEEPASDFEFQKAINHLEAFGTKGTTDFFSTESHNPLKLKSKLSFRNINRESQNILSTLFESVLGRSFLNNISIDKSFCIGTGSLATHAKLSVFEEMKYLQNLYSEINLESLIKYSSLNGANLLGFDHLGSFEKNKKPGVNLITNIDYENFRLKSDSKLKVLI